MKKLLLIPLCIIMCWMAYVLYRLSPAQEQIIRPHKMIAFQNVQQSFIGIIGDSWAASQKLDTIITNELGRNNKNYKVVSYGHPGATTKMVYNDLFKDSTKEYSSNALFYKKMKYCIVIDGVNDVAGAYGKDFYATNEMDIIETLLTNNITPVIVSVPEFGIQEEYRHLNPMKSIVRHSLALVTSGGEINTITSCRETLNKDLIAAHLQHAVIMVDFNDVVSDYSTNKKLYANPLHLNVAGNQKLGRYIVQCLIKPST